MKMVAVLIVVLLMSGCTMTKVTTRDWSVSRISFFQQVEIPALSVDTNGVVQLSGYKTDGGSDALQSVVEAAVRAAVSTAKGGVK